MAMQVKLRQYFGSFPPRYDPGVTDVPRAHKRFEARRQMPMHPLDSGRGRGGPKPDPRAARISLILAALLFLLAGPPPALAGVDVEVVEPEIDQHFLQLPLAVHRAQQLLGGERDDLLARESA
jgi:hypothetical protein